METPQAVVREIYEQHDLSEAEIAMELRSLGVTISQPTVNRIRQGTGGATRGELALLDALMRLRERLRVRKQVQSELRPPSGEGTAA